MTASKLWSELIRLNPGTCTLGHRTMKPSGNGKVIIRAPVADCGSTLTVGEPLHGYSKSACFLLPLSGFTLTVRLVCSSPLLLWCITTCCCYLRLQHHLRTSSGSIHKMSSWVLQLGFLCWRGSKSLSFSHRLHFSIISNCLSILSVIFWLCCPVINLSTLQEVCHQQRCLETHLEFLYLHPVNKSHPELPAKSHDEWVYVNSRRNTLCLVK